MINVSCYLSVLKRDQALYPTAHFVVVTRIARHVLSPSFALLKEAKALQKEPRDKLFLWYAKKLLIDEWHLDPEWHIAQSLKSGNPIKDALIDLYNLMPITDLFLVCYEKNPNICHRMLIKHLLEGKTPNQILTHILTQGRGNQCWEKF
jgi:hypothetical protein